VFEEYLTWLLGKTNAISDPSEHVVLQAAFDAASVGGDLDDIQSIEIGGLVPEKVDEFQGTISPAQEVARDSEEVKKFGTKKAYFQKAMKVLENLLGPLEAEKIRSMVPEEASLEVLVNIGYRAKRKGVDRATLREIATSLRNIDDGELKVRAKEGKLQGGEVFLQTTMPFKRLRSHGNLLELEHVKDQLIEVHRRFLQDGKIN